MGSVLIDCAERAAVPAGGALAVDRERFSALVEEEVARRSLIEVIREEVVDIPEGSLRHRRGSVVLSRPFRQGARARGRGCPVIL